MHGRARSARAQESSIHKQRVLLTVVVVFHAVVGDVGVETGFAADIHSEDLQECCNATL